MDLEVKPVRCFSKLKKLKFKDENVRTITSKDQINTETLIEKCFDRFDHLVCLNRNLPRIHRDEHIQYLDAALRSLATAYECLDCSRPWLVYWILNSACLLGHTFPDDLLDGVVSFLTKCRSPDGGFGGGPGQYPHLAPTYAAVNSLCIIGTDRAYEAIDRKSLKQFLWSIKESNGAFRMHVDGEIDVRGAYCAISSAKLANFSKDDEQQLFKNTVDWIASCQTYEGGIGGTPDLEAHGGYTFCAIAAMTLLGSTGKCDLKALLRWTIYRQMSFEGGFQGRTNKLVDGCYSFWQGAIMPIVQALINKTEPALHDLIKRPLFNRGAVQEYVLICCQRPSGGLIDKPGKSVDLYHTCYTLSGLAIAQHCEIDMQPYIIGPPENEVFPTHPLHNIPAKAAWRAYLYFEANNYDLYCEKNENGIWGDVDSDTDGKNRNSFSQMSGTDDVEDDDEVDTSKCKDDTSFTTDDSAFS